MRERELLRAVAEYITEPEGSGKEAARERNIRTAVERVFERNGACVIEKFFGNTVSWEKGKLTNKAFLRRVAEIVRKRMGMEDSYGV